MWYLQNVRDVAIGSDSAVVTMKQNQAVRNLETVTGRGALMATIQEKLATLENIKAKIEMMIASGVDLNSPEAVPLGVEFITAFDDLAQEFGHKILVPLDKSKADFIRPDPATQN